MKLVFKNVWSMAKGTKTSKFNNHKGVFHLEHSWKWLVLIIYWILCLERSLIDDYLSTVICLFDCSAVCLVCAEWYRLGSIVKVVAIFEWCFQHGIRWLPHKQSLGQIKVWWISRETFPLRRRVATWANGLVWGPDCTYDERCCSQTLCHW